MEFEIRVSLDLVGCERTMNISLENDLEMSVDEWNQLTEEERGDLMYSTTKEYMSEYVEYSWDVIEFD